MHFTSSLEKNLKPTNHVQITYLNVYKKLSFYIYLFLAFHICVQTRNKIAHKYKQCKNVEVETLHVLEIKYKIKKKQWKVKAR